MIKFCINMLGKYKVCMQENEFYCELSLGEGLAARISNPPIGD